MSRYLNGLTSPSSALSKSPTGRRSPAISKNMYGKSRIASADALYSSSKLFLSICTTFILENLAKAHWVPSFGYSSGVGDIQGTDSMMLAVEPETARIREVSKPADESDDRHSDSLRSRAPVVISILRSLINIFSISEFPTRMVVGTTASMTRRRFADSMASRQFGRVRLASSSV